MTKPIRPWLPAALAVAAVGIGSLVASAPTRAKSAKTKSLTKASDVQHQFPGLIQLNGKKYAKLYLDEAERVSKIPEIATFGLAASFGESAWNNLAVNDSPAEATQACKAWRYQRTRKLQDSPYQKDALWCWGTGGWFGGMPAYDLAREPFSDLNPIWAEHDPATSTAMFVAGRHDVIRKYLPQLPKEHQNWLAVRRAMASLKTFYDYAETGQRAKDVRERFARHLRKIGVDPEFMYQRPVILGYPGNRRVWDALRSVQPLSVAA